jgi:hypothetical protein
MTVYRKSCLIALLVVAAACLRVPAAENQADFPLRMANGSVIEGAVQEATPEGLVIQGAKGKYTAPWKYLSAGTRYRYERPMLVAQEAARVLALKQAQEADAKKAAADKAAAAKAVTTNATGTNVAGAVSNTPPAKR